MTMKLYAMSLRQPSYQNQYEHYINIIYQIMNGIDHDMIPIFIKIVITILLKLLRNI